MQYRFSAVCVWHAPSVRRVGEALNRKSRGRRKRSTGAIKLALGVLSKVKIGSCALGAMGAML